MKIKIYDNPLDLEKASSILLVGIYDTGKIEQLKRFCDNRQKNILT